MGKQGENNQKRLSGVSVDLCKGDSVYICVDRGTHVEGRAGDYDSGTTHTDRSNCNCE